MGEANDIGYWQPPGGPEELKLPIGATSSSVYYYQANGEVKELPSVLESIWQEGDTVEINGRAYEVAEVVRGEFTGHVRLVRR